jgi:O-methyltransferase
MQDKSAQDRDIFELDHRPLSKAFFKGYPIISDQITAEGLLVVWDELEAVLQAGIEGDIVEFGCYVGTTSLFIRRLLDTYHQSDRRTFHVYDSFQGLPEKQQEDKNAAGIDFKAGKLFVSKKEFIHQFHSAALQVPLIHKGWFNELPENTVPRKIAFAFLDGDFYDSIISSLRLIWPHMRPGGKILVDDYKREALPGVTTALHDFFQAKPVRITRRQANIARIEL